jgi:thioredoxin 1
LITLTDASFDEEVLKNRQPVLVEFYAFWSGTHHIITPSLRELSVRYGSRMKFCMVDVSNHKVLSEKYDIWNIPTIVLFKNGHPVDYIVGIIPKTVMVQKLDVLLEPEKKLQTT